MSKTDSVFTQKQQDQLMRIVSEILNSKFKDPSNPPTPGEIYKSYGGRRGDILDHYQPGAFDYSNPETIYREYWRQYVEFAALNNTPTNKKGTRRRDTSVKRSGAAKQLAKVLGRKPTAADLKAAFPLLTELDEELSKAIDRDIENLI